MSTIETDEKQALTDLIESDGWAYLTKAAEVQWGDAAVIQLINQALANVPRGDQQGTQDTVAQILTSQRDVRAILAWPKLRLAQLAGAEKKPALFGRRRA